MMVVEGGGGGGGGGPTPPVISNVLVVLGTGGNSATVTFNTAVSATTVTRYRRVAGSELSPVNTPAGTTHSATLTGLVPPNSYEFYIESAAVSDPLLKSGYPSCSTCAWQPFGTSGAPTVDGGFDHTYTDGQIDGVVDNRETFNIGGTISLAAGHTGTWKWMDGTQTLVTGSTPYSGTPITVFGVGTHTLTFIATDTNNGLSAQDTVLVTLNGNPPDSPVFSSPAGSGTSVEVGTPVSVTFTASDADPGDDVAITFSAKPSWMFCDGSDTARGDPISRTCDGTPTAAGSYPLTAVATDQTARTATKSYPITVTATPPTVNAGTDRTITDGQYDGQINDQETFSISGNVVFVGNHTGSWEWEDDDGGTLASGTCPAGGCGNFSTTITLLAARPHVLTLKAIDDVNLIQGQDTVSVNLLPGDPPDSPDFTSPAQTSYSINTGQFISITFTATDPDAGDTVAMSVVAKPSWITCTGNDVTRGNPISRVCSGTPTVTGSNTLTMRATDTTARTRDITVTITVQTPNVAPTFTSPSATTYWVSLGDPLSAITFTAQDTAGELVTLSVDPSSPAWVSCGADPAPANPVSRSCSGTAPVTAGTHVLTLRATDNRTPALSTGKVVTIHVARFKDNSSILPTDTNRTRGADAGDIDGDGDRDLVIGHPPTAAQGARIWLNNSNGVSFSVDSAKLPSTNYRPNAIRFGRPNTGVPLNLFLSNWQQVNVPSCPAGYDWHETAYAYRLTNPGSGTFQVPAAGNFNEPVRVLTSAGGTAACWGSFYGTFASDIEIARFGPSQFRAFVANSSLGETLPNFQRFAYVFSADMFYWYDNGSARGNNCSLDGDCAIPVKTSDFELADVDGDGDLDVFAGGVAFYSSGSLSTLYSNPKLWRNTGANSGSTSNITPGVFSGWNGTWNYANYLEQKGAFADLNGDGRQDLVVVDIQHGIRIFRNTRTANGDGATVTFAADTQTPPLLSGSAPFYDAKEVGIADVNEDGKPDIVLVAYGYDGSTSPRERVFLNETTFNGSNNTTFFSEATDTNLSNDTANRDDSEGIVIFDVDSDNDSDILIHNTNGNKLYKNQNGDVSAPAPVVKPPAPCLSCGGGRVSGGG